MKIDYIDFETKKKIMISFNKGIISGHMNEKSISNLDKIFNKISYEECDKDVFLCNLWLEIKLKIRMYYEKNKELLNNFLDFVNTQLISITHYEYYNKKMVKKTGDYNGKKI